MKRWREKAGKYICRARVYLLELNETCQEGKRCRSFFSKYSSHNNPQICLHSEEMRPTTFNPENDTPCSSETNQEFKFLVSTAVKTTSCFAQVH